MWVRSTEGILRCWGVGGVKAEVLGVKKSLPLSLCPHHRLSEAKYRTTISHVEEYEQKRKNVCVTWRINSPTDRNARNGIRFCSGTGRHISSSLFAFYSYCKSLTTVFCLRDGDNHKCVALRKLSVCVCVCVRVCLCVRERERWRDFRASTCWRTFPWTKAIFFFLYSATKLLFLMYTCGVYRGPWKARYFCILQIRFSWIWSVESFDCIFCSEVVALNN